MYWNVVKKKVDSKYIKIIKSYPCFGINDYDMKYKANRFCSFLNIFRRFNNQYYYIVEYSF